MLRDLEAAAALAPDAITLPGATAIRQQVVLGTRRGRWLPAGAAVLASLAVLATAVLAGGAIGGDDRGRATADPATPLPPGESRPVAAAPVVERPILVPRGSLQEAPVWHPGDLAADPPQEGEADPAASSDARPEAPARRRSARPARRRPPSRRPPPPRRPTTTAAGTAAATYRYADCSAPAGRAGASWVFFRFDGLGCSAHDIQGSGADREAWVCGYGNGNWIVFARWGSPQDAKSYYRSWFNPNYLTQQEWYRKGARHGVHLFGRSGRNGSDQRSATCTSMRGSRGRWRSTPRTSTRATAASRRCRATGCPAGSRASRSTESAEPSGHTVLPGTRTAGVRRTPAVPGGWLLLRPAAGAGRRPRWWCGSAGRS